MKERILLKEIPSDQFHSAIFTTYSINLYYLEQQVLPMLGSKGIHYVSILADGEMLSSQLESLSSMSENKRRTYAIHGIQSKGAFHPKLIFLAGDTSFMLLMGSGNLTSCGHGKNLEVWNAFYVDNTQDSKWGFLIQAWNYLKQIHKDLGLGALSKIRTIEENCSLLKLDKVNISESYNIDTHLKASFLTSQPNRSLFSQLVPVIGTTKIEKITLMTPFYDIEGSFIQLLNDTFKPRAINIILQQEFGKAPVKMKPSDNMHLFDWENVKCESNQKYFHAKNLVFEGKNTSFLLSGSANASVAAFGTKKLAASNYEACVLYQSDETDYIELLGIRLNGKKTDLSLFKDQSSGDNDATKENPPNHFFIKSAELNSDTITVQLSVEVKLTNTVLCIFDAKGKLQFESLLEFSIPKSSISIIIPQTFNVLYCYLKIGTRIASNKQFIIDINAFESTNPSQKNRSLNQLRKIIESKGPSTIKIIDYLNTIYQAPITTQKVATASDIKAKGPEIIEDECDLLYMPYSVIQEKIKHFDNTKHGKVYIEYKSVRLWDSILSYLKDSREKAEGALIDEEEETKDLSKSIGRKEVKPTQSKKPISQAVFEKIIVKIEKFLIDYIKTLESKIEALNTDKPSIIDLSMYLIMLEILLQHANSKELILENSKEEFLIHPGISNAGSSWSGYTLKIIGLFSLWLNKKGGFKDIDNQEYRDKFLRYQTDAFNLSVFAITIFEHINRNNQEKEKIDIWVKLELLNALNSFSSNIVYSYLSNDYLMYLNDNHKTILAAPIKDKLINNLIFLNGFSNKTSSDSCYSIQNGSGYIYVNKITYAPTSNMALYKIDPSWLFFR